MLGSKSVIEVQHSGACRCAEAPRKISHQRFGPECVAAAMEIENVSVGPRLRYQYLDGLDAIDIDDARLRP